MGGLFRHLLLPQSTNNHRAKALHLDAMLVYISLFLVFELTTKTVQRQYPTVLGYATDIYTEQLLSGTNAKRQEVGLSPLTLNQQLSQAAAGKAQDMFSKNYWAHYSPDGKTPWDFIIGSGYRYSVAGENLAKNFSTSQSVVDAWMASSSHKDNLLKSSYRDVGFAIVNGVLNGEETTLVVQMFGATSGQVAQAPKPQPTTLPTQKQIAVAATIAPEPTEAILPTTEPTLIPVEVPPALEAPTAVALTDSVPPPSDGAPFVASAFASVTKHPIIDISRFTRDSVLIFLGVLMGVLIVDAWIVAQKRLVRATGHTIAHFFFFAAVAFLVARAAPGAIL